MADKERVIADIEEQIAWIRDNDFHKFPGWGHVVLAMKDALELLKDRTKDYEAWAKEIGVDTCVNCRHASFNRNDGKSTCPIEHNFALVKDGFCHLFMRMEGR